MASATTDTYYQSEGNLYPLVLPNHVESLHVWMFPDTIEFSPRLISNNYVDDTNDCQVFGF